MSSNSLFSLSSTDRIDRIIINLKVLAAIRTHERLTVQNSWFQIQENSWKQPLKRWYNGDTRWSNITAIKRVVNDAMNILELYLTHDEETTHRSQHRLMERLQEELSGVKVGLENFKETYAGDKTLRANVDVLLQHITCVVGRVRREISSPRRIENSNFHSSSPTSSLFSQSPDD